jgi:hypothetical protein
MWNQDPEDTLKALVGKKPWRVSAGGVGTIVTFEFGPRDPRQSTPGLAIHGEWQLWLYMCSWRIEHAGEVVVACEDDRDTIRRIFRQTLWTPIVELNLLRPALDLDVLFESKHRLRTFSVNCSEDREFEQWILFTPYMKSIAAKGCTLEVEDYSAHSQPVVPPSSHNP